MNKVAGIVIGFTCPACKVKCFSSVENRGAEFNEGSVTADSDGKFTFITDTPFSGTCLTDLSTTPNGNTSAFSLPANVE